VWQRNELDNALQIRADEVSGPLDGMTHHKIRVPAVQSIKRLFRLVARQCVRVGALENQALLRHTTLYAGAFRTAAVPQSLARSNGS